MLRADDRVRDRRRARRPCMFPLGPREPAGDDVRLTLTEAPRYITQVMNHRTTEGTGWLREMAGLDEGAPLFVQIAERLPGRSAGRAPAHGEGGAPHRPG